MSSTLYFSGVAEIYYAGEISYHDSLYHDILDDFPQIKNMWMNNAFLSTKVNMAFSSH